MQKGKAFHVEQWRKMLGVEEGCAFIFIFLRPQLTFYAKEEEEYGEGRHNSGTSGPSEALAGDQVHLEISLSS